MMSPTEAEAAYQRATARLQGAFEPEVIERELATLREVADAGCVAAQYAYAYSLDFFTGDDVGGVPYLIMAARQGHEEALTELRWLYARREKVRALVSERLTAEEVATMGLCEGNFFSRLCHGVEGGNSPLGLLIGLLFIGGVGVFLLSQLLSGLSAGLGGDPLTAECLMLQSIYLGAFLFCLCGVVGIVLEWRESGSGAEHPLAFACLALFVGYLSVALFGWGYYEFRAAPHEDEYWWLPAVLCCLGGGMTGGFLIRVLAAFRKVLAGRASRA